MRKREPSIQQLIQEVETLRRQVAELQDAAARRERAEEARGRVYDDLEDRVHARTAALAAANVALQEEIAERKRAEEALRAIIDAEPECVKMVATDGTLLLMNQAGLSMVEADSLEQLIGKSFDFFLAPEYCEAFQALNESVFRGNKEALEFEIIGLKGTHRWVETHAVPLYNEQHEIVAALGITRDITERRRAEEERLKLSKLEALGLLAGGIAHDFNNLLTAILGNLTLTRIAFNPADPVISRLTEAEHAVLRAKDLTQQLLTFAKGGAPIKKITSLASLLVESARFALRGAKARCEWDIPDDLWPVDIDEGQISQVVHNLIINADQAMPNGGPITIRCANLTLEAASTRHGLLIPDGPYVQVAITDQGIGIPEEYLPKVFDPYFTTKPSGSGLGLATAYSIIKNHRGAIVVDSTVGMGTTATLYLPAARAPVATPTAPSPPEVHTPLHTGKGKILVMDDEEMIRTLVERILARFGYEVVSVKDGVEAIEAYTVAQEAGQPFDAVIMDLTVPGGMGGKEAIQCLRAIDPCVKAIVSSGYSTDPIMANFREYGFRGVVAKPYRIQELVEALQSIIEKDHDER